MLELLAAEGVRFDDFRLCLHHPEGVVPELARVCDCRKPAPGMLLDAAGELEIDLGALVDDRGHRRRRAGGPGGGLPHGADRASGQRPQARGLAAPTWCARDSRAPRQVILRVTRR